MKYNVVIAITPLVFAMSLVACSDEPKKKQDPKLSPDLSYTLCVGTDREVHEQPGPDASGGGGGESLIVRLNGHPILIVWKEGFSKPVNQFMVDKENTIEIDGRISTKLRLKVNKYDGDKYVDLVRKTIDPKLHNVKTKSAFEFSDEVPYRIVAEIVKGDESRETAVRKAVLESARNIYRAISSGKHAAAASLLGEGYQDWARVAYGQSREDIDGVIANYKKFFQSKGFVIEEPDWDTVKVVIGKRSVLVYADWNHKTGNPFLFKVRAATAAGKIASHKLWALRFVYQRGKWVVWCPQ